MRQLAQTDIAPVQLAVDYWFDRVAASFGRLDSARIEGYRRYRLRTRSNEELLGAWRASVVELLQECQLRLPSAGRSS